MEEAAALGRVMAVDIAAVMAQAGATGKACLLDRAGAWDRDRAVALGRAEARDRHRVADSMLMQIKTESATILRKL